MVDVLGPVKENMQNKLPGTFSSAMGRSLTFLRYRRERISRTRSPCFRME